MARFHGEVGYGKAYENPEGSGKWVNEITEYVYTGDVVRASRSLEPGDGLNSDIRVSNSIRIVADDHAFENFMDIKYVRWSGTLWTVTSVEVQRPRLILTLGSVYNGPTP